MLKVVTVIPARGGVTGASLAVAHIMLGLLTRFPSKIGVTIVTSSEAMNYPVFKRLKESGADFVVLKRSRLPSVFYWMFLGFLLLSCIRGGVFHVSHFSTPKAVLFLWPFAKIVSRKTVLSLEGYPPFELTDASTVQRLVGTVGWLLSLRLVNHVAACSEWMTRVAVKAAGFEWKISTVHNPVDVERFVDKGFSVKRDVLELLVVARLHPVKGVETALKALYKLLSRGVNAFLTVVGDGPERTRLVELAEKLGIKEFVRFEGIRYDVENFIKKADVVLVPSRYEPFGMVAAEAGAACKPVVASRVGGLPEIIEENVTGLLFEGDNPEDLAEKIENLMNDSQLQKVMGENASRRVLSLFSPEVAADKVLNLYLALA